MGVLISQPIGCAQFPVIQLPLCSGHGRCVMYDINGTEYRIYEANRPNSQCICDPGWSGYNDYISMDTHDCGINTEAVVVVWVFVLITSLMTLCMAAYKLTKSVSRFKELVQDSTSSILSPSADKSQTLSEFRWSSEYWRIFLRWPVVRISLLTVIPAIGLMATASYRIMFPERAVGISLASTVIYHLGALGTRMLYRYQSMSWLKVRKKLVPFTEQEYETTRVATSRVQFIIRLAQVTELGCICLVFTMCFRQQQATLLTFIYFNIEFVTCVSFCYGFYAAARAVEQILAAGLENAQGAQREDLQQARIRVQKVASNQKEVAKGSLPYLLMAGYWPWLRSKLAYTWCMLGFLNFTMMTQMYVIHPPIEDDNLDRRARKNSQFREVELRTLRTNTACSSTVAVTGKSSPIHTMLDELSVSEGGVQARLVGKEESYLDKRRSTAELSAFAIEDTVSYPGGNRLTLSQFNVELKSVQEMPTTPTSETAQEPRVDEDGETAVTMET